MSLLNERSNLKSRADEVNQQVSFLIKKISLVVSHVSC